MSVLVSDLVSRVINELSQVPGVATQIYSADRIRQFIENAYLLEIDEIWWPQYMVYLGPIPLDPVTGLLTADLQGPISVINDYTDIRVVWPDGRNKALRELSHSLNPAMLTGSGGRGWYMTPDYTLPNRPFKVLPVGSVGTVMVHARQHNVTPLALTDRVYLDTLLLIYDACWMYATDDGTVPQQVQKYQMLAHKRRQRMIADTGNQPLELDPRYTQEAEDTTFFVLDQDPLA